MARRLVDKLLTKPTSTPSMALSAVDEMYSMSVQL